MVDGDHRVAIVTNREMREGEELFYNYHYDKRVSGDGPPCSAGTALLSRDCIARSMWGAGGKGVCRRPDPCCCICEISWGCALSAEQQALLSCAPLRACNNRCRWPRTGPPARGRKASGRAWHRSKAPSGTAAEVAAAAGAATGTEQCWPC